MTKIELIIKPFTDRHSERRKKGLINEQCRHFTEYAQCELGQREKKKVILMWIGCNANNLLRASNVTGGRFFIFFFSLICC